MLDYYELKKKEKKDKYIENLHKKRVVPENLWKSVVPEKFWAPVRGTVPGHRAGTPCRGTMQRRCGTQPTKRPNGKMLEKIGHRAVHSTG